MNDEGALIEAIHELAKSNNKVADNLAGIVTNIFSQMLTKADLLEHEKREEVRSAKLFSDIKMINEQAIRSDQTWQVIKNVLTYGSVVALGFSFAVLAVIKFSMEK